MLVLASNDTVRAEIVRQVSSAFGCVMFSASGVRGAFDLLQRESPDVTIVHPEFAFVAGTPIAAAIAACCPATLTVIYQQTPVSAAVESAAD